MQSKKVYYGKNKYVIVDADVYDWIKTLPLYEAGKGNYPTTHFKCMRDGKVIYCRHRLHAIINQTPEGKHTDHINGNIYDNRRTNLRTVTVKENNNNIHNHRSNAYLPGVFKKGNKYRSRIVIDGEKINLGYFDTPEEAHNEYMRYKTEQCNKIFNNHKSTENKRGMERIEKRLPDN